jgi:hypothetical protein
MMARPVTACQGDVPTTVHGIGEQKSPFLLRVPSRRDFGALLKMLSGDLVLQSGHGDLTAHLTVGCSAQQTLIGGCFGLQVAERGTPRRLVCSAPLINCSALSRWPDLIAHSAHSTILPDPEN